MHAALREGQNDSSGAPTNTFDRLAIRTALRVTRRSPLINNARRRNRRCCTRRCWHLTLGRKAKRHLVMRAWHHRSMFWTTCLRAALREPMRRSFGLWRSKQALRGKEGWPTRSENASFRTTPGTVASKHSTTPCRQHCLTCCPTSWRFALFLHQRRDSKPRCLRPFSSAVVAVPCEALVGHCGLAPRACPCECSVKLS